jgi:hypothetical protein
MLATVFGNKNVQKILIFLFVNGKCYGTELHRLLNTPLTPLQKALSRLEKGGVITSNYEGKTRIYQFNPAFPLLTELELLLKKAYTLLSPTEKGYYCCLKRGSRYEKNEALLMNFWKRLGSVKHLLFHARTKLKEEGGWQGRGQGEVSVTHEGENILIFQEKGSWKNEMNKEIDFSNTFRWTFDQSRGVISLEHLRRGPNHPVFLFHLAPSKNHCLISLDPHHCAADTYFGQLFCDQHSLRLHWRVIGPKKNEEMDYYYT